MSLSDAVNSARHLSGKSNKDLEAEMRLKVAPLITFLERVQEYDDRYPDLYPEDRRVKGEPYRADNLNQDSHGWTLEHSVYFSKTGEDTRDRTAHGLLTVILIRMKILKMRWPLY